MEISMEVRQAICKQCEKRISCAHLGSEQCTVMQNTYGLYLADLNAGKGKHEKPEPANDVVNNPQHYQHGTFEVIDEMLIAFGPEKTFTFCILNAWKYRSRAPYKGKPEEDMDKADRYMQMARSIAAKNPDAFPVYTHLIKNEDDN